MTYGVRPSVTYIKQPWRCESCRTTGLVLFRDDDSQAEQERRLKMSHESHSKERHGKICRAPKIILTEAP
jgi:hypothetical protein